MNHITLFHLVFSSGLLPREFQIKILYEFPISSLGHNRTRTCLLSITSSLKRSGRFLQIACAHKKRINSSDFRGRPFFQVGHHLERPQRSLCANVSNHVTANTTRPLSYWSTAFGISKSSESRTIVHVRFQFHPRIRRLDHTVTTKVWIGVSAHAGSDLCIPKAAIFIPTPRHILLFRVFQERCKHGTTDHQVA